MLLRLVDAESSLGVEGLSAFLAGVTFLFFLVRCYFFLNFFDACVSLEASLDASVLLLASHLPLVALEPDDERTYKYEQGSNSGLDDEYQLVPESDRGVNSNDHHQRTDQYLDYWMHGITQ
jgi:hypothetical protein